MSSRIEAMPAVGPRRAPSWMGLILLAALLLGLGCLGRSPSVRLFTLGTLSPLEAESRAPNLAVLIGPVRLPAYLERPQIARLKRFGEIQLDEFNRWVGGFEKNLIRAVETGVRNQLGSDRVVGYPSGAPFPFDRQVRIHVDEMIVDSENNLRARIRWAVLMPGEESAAGRGMTSLLDESLPVRDRSVEALVEAHDAILSKMAQRIADQLAPDASVTP